MEALYTAPVSVSVVCFTLFRHIHSFAKTHYSCYRFPVFIQEMAHSQEMNAIGKATEERDARLQIRFPVCVQKGGLYHHMSKVETNTILFDGVIFDSNTVVVSVVALVTIPQ